MKLKKIIFKDRTSFYLGGLLHRGGNKPAIVYKNSTMKEYYVHGQAHREDGPACYVNEDNFNYFLFGKHFSKEDYDIELAKLKAFQLLNLID